MTSSNTTRFWSRFKTNKAALVSIGFIVILIVLALFAYPLATDDSEDANRWAVEISAQKPGFVCSFFVKPNDMDTVQRQGLDYLFHGRVNHAEYIPIRGLQVVGDSILLQHIVDDETMDTVCITKSSLSISPQWTLSQIKKAYVVEQRFWLGTDKYGRDVLSRLLLGARVSLAVGFIAVFISILIGVGLGCLSGYYGGFIDHAITWLINVIWAIPTLLLVFAITMVLDKGFFQIFIAIGLTMWVGTARLIRGQVMSIKELEYIQAAKVMGYSSFRIILKHVLPNILGPTIVMASSNFATAILIEAGLSFLGIGVQPPVSSWGLMIKENYNFIITNRPLLALIPGLAIMLTVLAFNILGNALRDALDVKS